MNNGSTIGELPADSLPEHRMREEHAFIAKFELREHLLDTTRQELDAARIRVTQLETEAEGLRSHIATLESRMASCVLERDLAVSERVSRETVLVAMVGLMRQMGVPLDAQEPAGA